MKLSNIFLFFIVFFVFSDVLASSGREDIIIDFPNMSLTVVGIYNPQKDGSKNGLGAEFLARKNALDIVQQKIVNTCHGIDSSSVSVKDDWQSAFHSQGTEIYSNGVFAVSLKASLKQLFKFSLHLQHPLKTRDGRKIVFKLPSFLSYRAMRCGSFKTVFRNNNTVQLLPTDIITVKKDQSVLIVPLVLSSSKSELLIDNDFKQKQSRVLSEILDLFAKNQITDFVPITVLENNDFE